MNGEPDGSTHLRRKGRGEDLPLVLEASFVITWNDNPLPAETLSAAWMRIWNQ